MKTKTPFIPSSLHSESLGSRYLIPFFLLLLITSSLHSQIPSYVPTNGLVGYWPFNGNANDESGNGNHGTVNGATLTADRAGNLNSAYTFNSNSYILVPYSNTINSIQNGLTMSAWILMDGGSSAPRILELRGSYGGGGDAGFAMLAHTNVNTNRSLEVRWHNNFGNTNISIHPTQQMSCLAWHHVLFSCNGTEGTGDFYLDGIMVGTNNINSFQGSITSCNYNFNNLFIGAEPNLATFWGGLIDDIAIYNRALTQEEITALYTGETTVSGCTNSTACNYNAAATQDDGSCTYPTQTYLNCAGTCINDADNDGTCDELENPTLPSYLPANGLVGYWPFNGNANDESGNGNHGTVNGATLTTDRNGNANSAYSFDGISNEIIITDHPTLNFINSDLSICSWINTFSSESNHIFHKGLGSGNDNPKYIFTINNNNYAYHVNGPNLNTGVWAYSNAIPQMLVWENVCIVKSNDLISFFINGSLNSQTNFATPNPSTFGINAKIGGGEPNGQGWFNGLLDDIAIYNRALTPEEITALYNETTTGGGGGNGGTTGTPAPSVPQGIPYQAMIRDNNGAALVNTPVTVRFSLHQDAIDGTVEYQETHNLTTNAFGLVNTHFGSGTATQGTFANINWSNTTKFIQVEANTGSGFVEMGTQQMMSVPFALQSNRATSIKNAGLPVFADNAAALAGGLVAGDMYRTATGDLKIVY